MPGGTRSIEVVTCCDCDDQHRQVGKPSDRVTEWINGTEREMNNANNGIGIAGYDRVSRRLERGKSRLI